MTYTLDFRLKVKQEENLTYTETARRFKIGKASLVRWNKKPEPQTSHNKPPTKIDMERLKEDLIKNPDSYQYERAQRFNVSKTGIYCALKRLGVSDKKR